MTDQFYKNNAQGVQDYNSPGTFRQYPIEARDLDGIEGAFKRYTSLPAVKDLREVGLFGVQLIAPHVYRTITDDYLSRFLTSAMNEVEMSQGMILSPTEFFHSVDYVEGMFESNWTGIKLPKFPTTSVMNVSMKFVHTYTTKPFTDYELPASWLALSVYGKLNIIADTGAIGATYDSGGYATAGGYFLAMANYNVQGYRPGAVEVRYKAGFENDRVPAIVADLVLTVASLRLLQDISPIIAPFAAVSVGIDGVSQSASLVPNFLLARISQLEQKRREQQNAITKAYGRTIKMTVLGS